VDNAGNWNSYITLQGQNENATIIQLIDSAPGFQDPANPAATIYTAADNGTNNPSSSTYNALGGGNTAFQNNIMGLTVNTGSNNPGVVGIDYIGSNDTRVSGVSIISNDGSGLYGLNLQRAFEGPLLVSGVDIEGFQTAIPIANSLGVWMEHIRLSRQSVSGIDAIDGSASIRDLQSNNSVPAVRIPGIAGVVSLVDSTLVGGAPSMSAIQLGNAGVPTLFLRNTSTSGYQSVVSQGNQVVPGASLAEWTSTTPTMLFSSTAPTSLNLPVEETPTYTDNDFANWTNVVTWGAQPFDPLVQISTFDCAPSIQSAIDSGFPTVYLPHGIYPISDTIHIRGSIERFLSLGAVLVPLNGQFPSGHPAVQIDNVFADTVFIENLGLSTNFWVLGPNGWESAKFPDTNFIDNSSSTLVLTNAAQIGYANTSVAFGSTVFLESVCGYSGMTFTDQNVFARHLDPENWDTNPHVHVSGGSLWDLGLKIEGSLSPVLLNDSGAATELLGVVGCVFVAIPASIPMFENLESSLSVDSFRTNSFEPEYDVLVQETLGGVSKTLFSPASEDAPTPYYYGSAGSLFVDTQVSPFFDVSYGAYYFSAANLLLAKGITKGCSSVPLDYCPTEPVTRAQMAIFVVRTILGHDPFSGSYSNTPHFSDVSQNDFGFAWIQKLQELGITTGCGGGNYCPDSPITRAQVAIFIVRARYGSSTVFSYPVSAYFKDVSQQQFGFAWIQRMMEDEITSGCEPAMYCPNDPVNRAEMAVFIARGGLNQLLPRDTPMIIGLNPATMTNGTTSTIIVTGLNTNFVQGVTRVNNSTGLIAGPATVLSPTTLTVPITAQVGLAQPAAVWVTTGAEDAVLPNGLLIQ
jgi:hypothetical protein